MEVNPLNDPSNMSSMYANNEARLEAEARQAREELEKAEERIDQMRNEMARVKKEAQQEGSMRNLLRRATQNRRPTFKKEFSQTSTRSESISSTTTYGGGSSRSIRTDSYGDGSVTYTSSKGLREKMRDAMKGGSSRSLASDGSEVDRLSISMNEPLAAPPSSTRSASVSTTILHSQGSARRLVQGGSKLKKKASLRTLNLSATEESSEPPTPGSAQEAQNY